MPTVVVGVLSVEVDERCMVVSERCMAVSVVKLEVEPIGGVPSLKPFP